MSVVHGGRFEAFCTVPSGVSISATTNAGTATVNVTAGSYTPTSLCAHLQTILNAQAPVTAGSWTVTLSVGRNGTGLVTIAVTAGTYSITWTSTLLRDLLGFSTNISSQSTSTAPYICSGLWMPDCPVNLEQDPSLAPKQTDNRATESPTGAVVTLGGVKKYQHKSLRYSHVEQARVREAMAVAAGIQHGSLEYWLDDTQLGEGHEWFARGSAFQVYWDNAGTETLVGADMNSGSGPALGWAFSPAVSDIHNHVKRVDASWLGRWTVEFSRLVSAG